MPIRLTADSFLKVLRQSGLVEDSKLDEVLAQFTDADEQPKSNAIADALVHQQLLTRWQADKILSGKHRGFLLGKFLLLDILGRGGMSTVYLARHTALGSLFALKVLPDKRVGDSSYLARFQREALAAATIVHPHIVRAYDIDSEGEGESQVHFIVMEYIDGADLYKVVKNRGPLPCPEAVEYIRQGTIGLQFAHDSGLVHRDVKPGNFIVDRKGVVRLLDLGLARFFEDAAGDQAVTIAFDERVLGTADYLAPEQAFDSHTVDGRADIYGLGCTFYFALTGTPPFNEGTLPERLLAHRTKKPPRLSEMRDDVPDDLQKILDRMMLKNADERFQSASEVGEVLAQWLSNHGFSVPDVSPSDSSIHTTDIRPQRTVDTGTLTRSETAVPVFAKSAADVTATKSDTVANSSPRSGNALGPMMRAHRRATAFLAVILVALLTAGIFKLMSLGIPASRDVRVGKGKDFPTISAAIRALKRTKQLSGPIVLRLTGGEEYVCRISIDPAEPVFQDGFRLVCEDADPAILLSDGIDPILRADRVGDIVLQGLDIRGPECCDVLHFNNLIPPLKLSDVEIRGFSQNAIRISRDADFVSTAGKIQLERVRIHNGRVGAVGLLLDAPSSADIRVSVKQSVFYSGATAGIRVQGGTFNLSIRESIFHQIQSGIHLLANNDAKITAVEISNNTFFETAHGIRIEGQVTGDAETFKVMRNLFAQNSDQDFTQLPQPLSPSLLSAKFNWTNRTAADSPPEIFGTSARTNIADYDFESLDPADAGFLKSQAADLPLTVGRPQEGRRAFVGAVCPPGL